MIFNILNLKKNDPIIELLWRKSHLISLGLVWVSTYTECTSKNQFTPSSFDHVIIYNFSLSDAKCWRSHRSIFPSNYFVMTLKKHDNSCFENFMPTSSQLGLAVAAVLWKYFAGPSVRKWEIGGCFDLIVWKQDVFLFHSIHQKYGKLQKLAFKHPIVVFKSGSKE